MRYGHRAFFREQTLARRRLALYTLALHGAALALALLLQLPIVRTWVRPARPIVRFGYEGPDRYVERIILATQAAPQAPLVDVGRVQAIPSREGGGGTNPSSRSALQSTRRSSRNPRLGDDLVTQLAQARARMASVPLVQSTELVIESMVQPRYPEQLHARGIEGRVALMALIDTTGHVADVSVVSASGHDEFEASAMEAVRQAKFRPYRVAGATQEVYAVIRYRFRIY